MINIQSQLANHSRVWIYQADRKLTDDEIRFIIQKGNAFTSTWAAHGNALTAELLVIDYYFVVLILDEEQESASGCSIDKSMKFILDLQNELSISFTNRLISAFWVEGKIQLLTLTEVKNALKSGQMNARSLVFDPAVSNLNELKINWLKSLDRTWLKKFLQPENV